MPKFARRPERRPDEILDSALKHFVADGFAAARMEEIAANAGVTAGTIYRYFPSKDSLVEALLTRHGDPSWSRGRDVADAYGSRTAREILELLLDRWADHLESHPAADLLMVVVREAPRFPEIAKKYAEQLITVGCLALERALRHGIDRGELPLLEIQATARALASLVVGDAIWRSTFGPHLPLLARRSEASRLAIEAMVRGLPRPGEAIPAPSSISAPADTGSSLPEPLAPGERGLRIVTLTPPKERP